MFLELCSFKDASKERLEDLILQDAATQEVLGNLFYNRMAAVACGVLQEHKLTGKVNREFRTAIENALKQNKLKNQSYFSCLKMLTEILRTGEGMRSYSCAARRFHTYSRLIFHL